MRYLIILFFISSCALFRQQNLSKNVLKASQNVCLNADGNGRLEIYGHKYVFGAETLYDAKDYRWAMSLNFPLYGQELIELQVNDPESEMIQNLEEKILREKKGVNPQNLQQMMIEWASFLKELIKIKSNDIKLSKTKFDWKVSKNNLYAASKTLKVKFSNFNGSYFGKMDFTFNAERKMDKISKIELIVRKCLNKID